MRASFKKSVAVTLAALALGVGIAASAPPASAHVHFGGGGFGGGFGGVFGHHFGHHFGFGMVDGGGYSDDSCVESRPLYDRWGNYVGSREVNVCD
jgi:hypothetical protein